MNTSRIRMLIGGLILALVAVGVIVIAGSGDTTDSAGATGVDRAFTADMVPHHKSAVEMAKIAQQRSQRPEIQKLADDIVRTQNDEVSQMTAIDERLASAGAKKGSLGKAKPAMMMGEDVSSLRDADPFDRAFIDMMIPHHQSAIEMARVELAKGEDAETKELATAVIAAQSKEIEQMNAYRKAWFGAASPAGGVPKDDTAGGASGY